MADQRNIYARIRTLMANERTLMSYYRTALTMIGIAVFLIKFYQSISSYIIAGVFGVLAIIISIYGTFRFLHFKKRLLPNI